MSRNASWWVTYATASDSTMVEQSMLTESPPPGYEGSVALLPVVHPHSAMITPTPWLVDGWLRLGGTTILSGRYKSLKSFIARQFALSVAGGLPFLGRYAIHESVRARHAVLVCAEE